MTCREIEKKIFIYPELTRTEKDVVNFHIQRCENCQVKARSVTEYRETLLKVAPLKGNEGYAPELTNKIMNAISDGHAENSFIFQLKSVTFWSVRYGLAAVSLGLIILLLTESMTTPEKGGPLRTERIDARTLPVMDSKDFMLTFRTRKAVADSRTWVKSECERICFNGDNPIACHRCEQIQNSIY